MPNTSFQINVTVKDIDGTNTVTSGNVYATNMSRAQATTTTVDDETIRTAVNPSTGEANLDLQSCKNQWLVGDRVYVYFKQGSGKSAVTTFTIKAGDVSYDDTIYAKTGEIRLDDCFLNSVGAACDSAKSLIVVDRQTGEIRTVLNVLANTITERRYVRGKRCRKGFLTMFVAVAATPYGQTAGSANPIGDRATNKTFTADVESS